MSKLASFPRRSGKPLDELQRHHMLALAFIKDQTFLSTALAQHPEHATSEVAGGAI